MTDAVAARGRHRAEISREVVAGACRSFPDENADDIVHARGERRRFVQNPAIHGGERLAVRGQAVLRRTG